MGPPSRCFWCFTFLGIIAEPELARFGRLQEGTRGRNIYFGNKNLDSAQPIERKAVGVPQRFTSHRCRNARGLEKCPHLLGMNLPVGDEHAPWLLVHDVSRRVYRKTYRPGALVSARIASTRQLNSSISFSLQPTFTLSHQLLAFQHSRVEIALEEQCAEPAHR
jgi:hypothetical protein